MLLTVIDRDPETVVRALGEDDEEGRTAVISSCRERCAGYLELGVCAVENDATIGGQELRERGRRHFAPPDQMLLLAPDVRDWLPEGHFAHHVSDLVDGLDLRAAPYEGDGRRNAPYEPRMKVLVYGYATGVFSSRGMARKLEEDVAFRVAGNFPSHRTLCEFRRRHGVQGVVRGGGVPGA